MSNHIEWTNDLSTGVEEIDWQHKECIRLINSLLDNDLSKKSGDVINNTFKFLSCYVREHFLLEEKLMKESAYDQAAFAKHKEFHNNFRQEASDLWRLHDLGEDVTMKLNYLLVNLFVNHISTMDKRMSRHLNAKMAESQSISGKLKALLSAVIKI